MKKLLRFLLPLICLVGLPLFSACQDPYEGMKVEVDKTSAVIYLGQTPSNEITVMATVNGSEILCESIFSTTSNKIQITTKYLGEGKTQATIRGIEPCLNSEVKVQTKENNKVTYFNVSVVQPISSLQLKSNSVNYGIFDESEGKTKTDFALSSSLFNFTPENTTQTDLTYQLLDTFNSDNVSLEGNILTVKNSQSVMPIRIRAISLADQNVFVDFTYTVLPSIQTAEISIDDAPIESNTLNFIKNNIDKSKHSVSISLNQMSGYPVKIKFILNTDTVVLTNSSTIQSGSKYTNNYILSAGLVGKCDSIKFVAYYENFEQVENVILELNSVTYEEIKDIILYRENNQNEIFEDSIRIYNQYSSLENDVPGLKMIFEAYPTSVPNANKKLLLNLNELQTDFYFYDANKNEIQELDAPYEISSGNFIYIKAKNTDIKEEVLTITSKDYPSVVKQIKLVRQVGVSELKFMLNEQEINSLLLTTNDVVSQEVSLKINENAEFGNVLISQSGSSFTYNYDQENNTITLSSVKDGVDENGSLTFTFENYFTKTLNIQTFKQLTSEDLIVTTETSLENPAVSVYVKNADNSVDTVVIKNGNSIKLNIDANDAAINNVSYSFKDIENLNENYDYSNINIDDASTGSNVISIFDGYITTTSVGYTKVFVVVDGYELKDGQKQTVKIEKSFLVEVYNPLISLELEKYQLSLYSKESLSAYDENLFEEEIAITINGESAPKNLNYVLDYSKYGNDYFKIEMLSNEETKQDFKLKVTAFKYEENSSIIPIVVSITEKFGLVKNIGITLQKRLNVQIVEATKLNMVEVTNVSSDGIYIDLTTTNTSLFQILTKTYPLNALNNNLRFSFIPDIDTNSSILSIDNNGLIQLSSEKLGGTGYIRIVPEDCYKFDENKEIYEDFRGNANNLVKLIRIYIADGKSEKTAKRIYDINEIKNNSSLHYSLMKNVSLSENLISEDFSGGLYGNLNGNGEKVTITLNNCSLFNILTESAVIKNLSIVGTTTNNGFICSVNKGQIINVSVDADLSSGEYNFSTLTTTNGKAGGIAGENNGEIISCEFSGKIEGTSYAGGITSTNNGLIENSTFYVYNYTNGFNTISADTVGVIATENSENGEITNCSAVLYSETETDFSNVLSGTEIEITGIVKEIKKPYNIDLSNVKIQNTESSIQEKNGYAILFYYVTEGEILSTEEKNIVNSWNVVDLKTLLGSNYDNNSLIIASNDVITATPNSIIINKNGEVTLTIFNKTNYDQSKIINILVTYPIRDFAVSYDGYILGDDTTLKVKSGTNVTFNTSILSQRMATNRYLKLKLNSNLKVNESSGLGAYSVKVENQNQNIEFKLSLDDEQEVLENYNQVLGQNIITVIINTYNGAEWISVNSNSISFEPYLNGNLHLEMLTDEVNDDIVIKIKNSNNELVYDSNSTLDVKENYDFDLIVKSSSNEIVEDEKWKKSYDIEISIKEDSKFKDFDVNGYKIYINARSLNANNNTSLEKVVDLHVEKQSIKRVEFLHYLLENNAETNNVAGYSSEPVNTVTPGDVGLLNISLFPLYSKFDYITITSPEVENNQLSLRLLNKNEQGDLSNADINVFSKINDGFRLEYNAIKSHYQTSNFGNFFIKTIVSSEVKVDVVFKIYVNVYVNEDVFTYEYNLTTRYLQKPTIFVNNESNYSYVAKNTFNDISIYVPKTQTFDVTDVLILPQDNESYFDEWEIDTISSSVYDIYKARVFIGNLDTYQILANVSWVINNKLQTKTEVFNIYALDFVVNSVGSALNVVGENKYYLSSYIDIATQLNIDLSLVYGENYESQVEKLLNNNYFIANYGTESLQMLSLDYIVNYFDDINYVNFNDEYINPLRNLYFVNGNEVSPVFNTQSNKVNENPYIAFEYDRNLNKIIVKGKATGIQNLRYALKVRMPNGQIRNIEFDFVIEVKVYTDEDTPRVISSVEDFINIKNEEEAQDYILINDIILENYVPFVTSKINTFDGNNKTIHIRSFDLDFETTDLSLALFSEVTSNTLIKNVTVNYSPLNTVEIDNSKISNINFAGFAVTNNGLISNCEVVAYPLDKTENNSISGLNVQYQYENIAINSTFAGFVITNGNTGSITNSRVGGEKIQKIVSSNGLTENITLKSFRIKGQGNIAGFVYENNGLISSSFVRNTYIENTSTQNYDSLTAGFVVYNRAGHINGSYVKGVANNSTEIHLSKYGITSLGISAGFVYQNSAKITDSYSNIKLTNNNNVGRASAGFVYINDKNGSIYRSFSASLIKNATTTQMNFSGVGNNQEYLNEGVIENSYYFDENVKYNANGELEIDSIEEYFDTPAIRIETINDKELYYGLSFAYDDNQNGIWKMTNKGPELISANNIAVSSRYLVELDEEKYVLPYVAGFDYGSINNPILIRTAEEFNEIFGNSQRTPIQNYYNLDSKIAFGSYRLVNNLDFSSFSSTTILNSSLMTLTATKNSLGSIVSAGMLDGNGFTISNVSMTANNTITDSFGLFKEIKNNAIIKNLNIIVGKTDEYSNVYGVTAGDTATVGTLAGKLTNASLSNVTISAEVGGVIIAGQNIVGALVGKVYNPINLTNLSAINISVKAYQTSIRDYVSTMRDEEFSYAGGLFGIVSNNAITSITNSADIKEYTPEFKTLKVVGASSIEGGIVGGVIGYVGKGIHIQDIQYIYDNTDKTQKITAYDNGYAGGIVGLLEGLINQSRSEYSEEILDQIEENVFYYYTQGYALEGDKELFYIQDYSPKYVGGLVGYMKNDAEIFRSYSKLNVINLNAEYAGGLVGYADSFVVGESYATGDVDANSYVGGLVGSVNSSIELSNVNALNVWNKDNIATLKTKNFGTITGSSLDSIAINCVFETVYSVGKIDNTNVNLPISSDEPTSSFINSVGVDQTFTYVDTKQNIIDFAEYVFKISDTNFNPDKWEKDDNNLYLDMRFIVKNNVYFINIAEDLELIKRYPDATFIINDMIDCAVFSAENSNFQIEYFAGILKGRDVDKEYGFKNLNLDNPLFNRVVNASFNNFTMQNTLSTTSSANAVLVNNAKGIELNSLKFKNYTLTISNQDFKNIALIVANIESGNSNVESLTLSNNKINVTNSNKTELNVGFVFGRANGNSKFDNIKLVNNANELSSSSNIISIGTSSTALNTKTINAGLVIGKGSSVNIINGSSDGELNLISGTVISYGITSSNGSVSHIGGIVGSANSLTIAKTEITQTLSVTGKNSYVGGIIGNLYNELKSSTISLNNVNIDVNAESSSIGGIIGNFAGQNITFTESTFVNKNVTITSKGYSSNAGGLIGSAVLNPTENVEMNLSTAYIRPTIKLENTSGIINAGGIVGFIKNENDIFNVSIIGSYFDGNITKQNSNKISLNAGGIVGNATNVIIGSVASYGNIYLTPDNVTKIDSKFNNIYTSAYIGGLVGYGDNITLKNSKSLTTIYNKLGTNVYENGQISAIIGRYENTCIFEDNEYCNQINLVTERTEIGNNKLYKDFDSLASSYNFIKAGEKGRPIIVENLNNEFTSRLTNQTTYYSLNFNENPKLISQIDIFDKNVFIVGNGIVVEQSGILANGLFKTIPENSVVSGISYRNINISASIEFDNVGAFASSSNGYVYACNTVGSFANGISVNSIYGNTNNIAGFIANNSGFISECFSSIDISSSKANVAGFVYENNGVIQSSYSTGAIYDGNNIEAFASGTLIDCYTISQIYNESTKSKVLNIFGSSEDLTNTWYDKKATQVEKRKDFEKNTSAVSLSYSSESVDYSELFGGNNLQIWGNNNGINYGYPSLTAGAYKDQSYMQIDTLYEVDESNKYYLIHNFGKLEQISTALNGNYMLAYDLDGTNIEFTQIAGSFTGKFNGSFKTVSNLSTSGIFESNNGIIKQLTLSNSLPNSENSALLVNKLTGGKIESIKVLYTKNIQITDKILSFGAIANQMLGGEILSCLIDGTSTGGSLYELEFNYSENQDAETNIYIGGLVSTMEQGNLGTINKSHSNIDIKVTTLNVNNTYLGGIVGKIVNGSLDSVSNNGNLTGGCLDTSKSYVGGISGFGGNISNAVNKGIITAEAKDDKIKEIAGYIETERKVKVDKYETKYYYAEYTKCAYASGISNNAIALENCYNISEDSSTNVFGGYENLVKPWKIEGKMDRTGSTLIIIGAIIIGIIIGIVVGIFITPIFASGGLAGLATAIKTLKICMSVGGIVLGAGAGGLSAWLTNTTNEPFTAELKNSKWNSDYIGYYYLEYLEVENKVLNFENLYKLFVDPTEEGNINKINIEIKDINNYLNDTKIKVNTIYSDAISYGVDFSSSTNNYNNIENFLPVKFNEFDEVRNSRNTLRNQSNDVAVYPTDLLFKYYEKLSNETYSNKINNAEINEISDVNENFENVRQEKIELLPTERGEFDVYEILHSGHFYYLVDKLINDNVNFKDINISLKSNISLIGTINQIPEFSGTFNGEGNTIFNINLNNDGLFKELSNATISMLELQGYQQTSNKDYSGFLASIISEESIVDNVSLYNSSINATNVKNVGGLIGQIQGNSKLENSVVNAEINAYSSNVDIQVAGVAGNTISTEKNTVSNNLFTGKVNAQIISTSKPNENTVSELKIIASGITNYLNKGLNSLENNINNGKVIAGTRYLECVENNLYYVPTNNAFAYSLYNINGTINDNALAFKPEKMSNIDLEANIISISNIQHDDDLELDYILIENEKYYILDDIGYCLKIDPLQEKGLFYKIKDNKINLDYYVTITGTEASNYILEEVSYKKTEDNTSVRSNGVEEEYNAYQRETVISYINYEVIELYQYDDDDGKIKTTEEGKALNITYKGNKVYKYTYIEQQYKLIEYFDKSLMNSVNISLFDSGITKKQTFSTLVPFDDDKLAKIDENNIDYTFIMLKEILRLHDMTYETSSSSDYVEITQDNISSYVNKCYGSALIHNNAIYQKTIESSMFNNLYEKTNLNLPTMLYKEYYDVTLTDDEQSIEQIDVLKNEITLNFVINNGILNIEEDYIINLLNTYIIDENGNLTSSSVVSNNKKEKKNTIFAHQVLFETYENEFKYYGFLNLTELKETQQYKELTNKSVFSNEKVSIFKNGNEIIVRKTSDDIHFTDYIYRNGYYQGYATYSIVILDEETDLNTAKFFVKDYVWTEAEFIDGELANVPSCTYVYYKVRNDFIIKYEKSISFKNNIDGCSDLLTNDASIEYIDSSSQSFEWTLLSYNNDTGKYYISRGSIEYILDGPSHYFGSSEQGSYEIICNNGIVSVIYDGLLYDLYNNLDDIYYNNNLPVFFKITFDTYGDLLVVSCESKTNNT